MQDLSVPLLSVLLPTPRLQPVNQSKLRTLQSQWSQTRWSTRPQDRLKSLLLLLLQFPLLVLLILPLLLLLTSRLVNLASSVQKIESLEQICPVEAVRSAELIWVGWKMSWVQPVE